MAVPVMVMITVFVHVIAINRLMWAHGRHEASSRRVIIYASAPRSHNRSARRTRLWHGRNTCEENAPARFLCGG